MVVVAVTSLVAAAAAEDLQCLARGWRQQQQPGCAVAAQRQWRWWRGNSVAAA